jgi:hypothetical protein
MKPRQCACVSVANTLWLELSQLISTPPVFDVSQSEEKHREAVKQDAYNLLKRERNIL